LPEIKILFRFLVCLNFFSHSFTKKSKCSKFIAVNFKEHLLFLMKILSFTCLWLLIFFAAFSFSQTVTPQSMSFQSILPNTDSEQSALGLETQAKSYKYQWNREALQNSIRFYLKAAREWRQSKDSDKSIECLREIGKLKSILGNNTKLN